MTALWLVPAVVIGSIFCFYMIEYIAYEETDEFLTYEMERMIDHHKRFGDLPEYHQASAVLPNVKYEKPFFRDTMLLEPADNEMVPHRELHFSINHKGTDFGIVLRHLLLGHDDIAFGTLMIIVGLVVLTVVFLLLIFNQVAGKIWKPFYTTLNRLTTFKIHEPIPVFPQTQIDEFNTLHTSLSGLLKKITDDYQHTKAFNTNASHELQTQLAVIRASAEKLMNETTHHDASLAELNKIHEASSRLSQAQKSLLLLSRISNREFRNDKNLEIRDLVSQAISNFGETAALRGIVIRQSTGSFQIRIDPGLADILINNLVKNAVKHNIDHGRIDIQLSGRTLVIENTGVKYHGDPMALMARFAIGPGGNSGIGLAIVKEICELYGFGLTYLVRDEHIHQISVRFHP